MHKFFQVAALAAVSLMLGACGGSTFTGSSSSGSGTTKSTVASLTVSTDVPSIPSDGSASANVTVIAKDANNAAVSGAVITFAASAGASITATQGTTDSSGTAKATLAAGTASAGTTVTITASIGTVSGTGSVTVSNAQKTITLLSSTASISSDNSTTATISAVVKDSSNNLLTGVPVSFTVDTGAISPVQTLVGATSTPSVAAGTTDKNGLAQATVSTPGDPSNRTITVTATAGTAISKITVGVSGTNLSLTGPASLVQNNSGSYTAVLTNSAGQGIPNIAVTLASSSGNAITAATVNTDATGHAAFTVKGTVGGSDTLTATALGLNQTLSLTVSTQSFTFTTPAPSANPPKVNLGVSQNLVVTWKNNGAAVVGQTVTFAATRGTLTPTTMTTDANGNAQVAISSTSAGGSIIEATANPPGGGAAVSAQTSLDFVATTPSQISVQAGPNAVPIQGTSTLTATVRDAANNPVESAIVNFQLQTDPTNGQLASPSAVTDAQGRAQVVYTAGNTSSGANGVTISATVASNITANTTLTVGGQAVGLSFGTGNTIDTGQGVAIYQVTYTVLAVDSHGAALPNIPITFTVLPVAYGKGVMGGCPAANNWIPNYSTLTTDPDAFQQQTMCKNEDFDYTGNINSQGVVGGHPVKDYNQNGTLDPGNIAVASPSSGMTDANGRLDVKITYPRDHAYWVEVILTASTIVQGTQSSTSSTFVLQGAVSDYKCGTGPPGPVSPYGVATTCLNPN